MDTPNLNPETRFALRADSILAYACGHGCQIRTSGSGQAAELIAIGQQWARIKVSAVGAELSPGVAISLEPGLKAGQNLPRDIPGRIAGRAGNELWVSFTAPLQVALLDLQSSLETCGTA